MGKFWARVGEGARRRSRRKRGERRVESGEGSCPND